MLGDGKCMKVGFYGDQGLDLHCEQDVRVTLTNVAVVPGLAFDIMSFDRMQEKHEIILNGAGASMLGGRVRLKKFRAGNFIQATRVPHDDACRHPPAMVAAMMRPGAPSSMNVNDFHNSFGHANIKILYEAAKQMGIKLTGIPFGHRRQALQGEVPTWGVGAITSLRPWSSTASSPGATPDPLAAATSSRGGGFPAATPAASAAPRGGGIPPVFSSGVAPTPLATATSSRGGGFPAATPAASAAPRGGGIPPMFSSGAAHTPLAAATSSRGGGFPAATPATSAAPRRGGIPPMSSSGAATTSATSSRGEGTPAAVPAATTSAAVATSPSGGGIPAAVQAAEVTGGTHVSGSGVGPPAVVGAMPTPSAPDPSVAAGAATGELSATGPETYVQAHTGPHSDTWTEAEGKKLRGLNATGTFQADGSE